MKRVRRLGIRLSKDSRGQDMIEYALTAGFIAVSVGVLMPNMASSIFIIYTKASSLLLVASSS